MLFNSSIFVQFFAAFLLLYWLLRHHLQARNVLVVIASYTFYGWWDIWFLLLLVAASVVDFWMGLLIDNARDPHRRKMFLAVSVVGNLTLLGFFKYAGFFTTSFIELMTKLHVPVSLPVLNIVLPMGISFYTFQTMSYTIDIYRREIKATRNLVNFLAFVSFFPQLVAGPIERAKHLLPQFERSLVVTFPMLQSGIYLCLWGMFKKVVVADNLAPLVEMVYHGGGGGTAVGTVLGTIAFAMQIYCDFSGYSDVARGTARILGFELMLNFNIPYAAVNIREFWRRWHISLSTWLRDYLYVSLGGNRHGSGRTYFNLVLTMLLGGLWHGAAWNFIWWGLWHGAGLAIHRTFASRLKNSHSARSPLASCCGWLATMAFVLYGWLLFRARTGSAIQDLTLSLGNFAAPPWLGSYVLNLAIFMAPVVTMEIWQTRKKSETPILSAPAWAQMLLQGTLVIGILMFWEKRHVPFYYFQF